jgi:tRNA (uracil-5-)-methyltransferase TRM9
MLGQLRKTHSRGFIINHVEVEVIQQLIEVNRQFYQTFAEPFHRTRRQVQPGVRKILNELPAEAQILDLGCGNGETWRTLQGKKHRGRYWGLDFSDGLLKHARGENQTDQASFMIRDLTTEDWDAGFNEESFDTIFAFAALHHIPGIPLRLNILKKIWGLLAPTGMFYLSVWQFKNSPRLTERIQPWEKVGLTQDQVESGDFLLDWRSGAYGLRYIHLFEDHELSFLADKCGFRIMETFFSDGQGGKLGLYQRWERV